MTSGTIRPDAEQFVRVSDIEETCACASRKCGPHRCWPSLVGWVLIGLLLTYTTYLHSTFSGASTKHIDELSDESSKRLTRIFEEKFTDATMSIDKQFADALVKLNQQLTNKFDAVTNQLSALKALQTEAEETVGHIQRIAWSAETAQQEKDVHLLEQIEALRDELADLKEWKAKKDAVGSLLY